MPPVIGSHSLMHLSCILADVRCTLMQRYARTETNKYPSLHSLAHSLTLIGTRVRYNIEVHTYILPSYFYPRRTTFLYKKAPRRQIPRPIHPAVRMVSQMMLVMHKHPCRCLRNARPLFPRTLFALIHPQDWALHPTHTREYHAALRPPLSTLHTPHTARAAPPTTHPTFYCAIV